VLCDMQSGYPQRQRHGMKRKYISKNDASSITPHFIFIYAFRWRSTGSIKRSLMLVYYVVVYKMVTNIRLHQSDICKVQFYKMLLTVALLEILVTGSTGGAYCNVRKLSASTLGCISYTLTGPSYGFP
jgi:hypothetical protein